MEQFEGLPLKRNEPYNLEKTDELLESTRFTDLSKLLDFYELNRTFFTTQEDADNLD